MNYIEVFVCDEHSDIQEIVNDYCEGNALNPVSISVVQAEPSRITNYERPFIVSVVVERR